MWKSPTNYIKQAIYYHIYMTETNKYIGNVEIFERQLTIKD